MMWWTVLGLVWIAILVFVLCMMRAAAREDKRRAKIYDDVMRRRAEDPHDR